MIYKFDLRIHYVLLQLLLLSESWKELFLLHLAQWSIPLDISAILNAPKAQDKLPKDPLVLQDVKAIQVS